MREYGWKWRINDILDLRFLDKNIFRFEGTTKNKVEQEYLEQEFYLKSESIDDFCITIEKLYLEKNIFKLLDIEDGYRFVVVR